MAKLTEQQKLFVVQCLATFRSPTEVQELLKADGIEAALNQIVRYDPTTAAGATLSDALKQAFVAARKSFIEDRESIAISHSSWRLRELQELYVSAKGKKLFKSAAALLEQAAKECGERGGGRDARDKRDPRDTGAQTPAAPQQDLSRLTDDELKTLETLAAKIAIDGGDSGREGSAESR